MATFYRCDRCKEEIRDGGITPLASYKVGEFEIWVSSVNPYAEPNTNMVPRPAPSSVGIGFAFTSKHFCKSCVHDIINGQAQIVRGPQTAKP